ncbi:TetR family transcriptional regulator [Herbaspirillum sp. ST 5-3]|uniref:TetR family transcriptional regulator n=1 Tax=Oxalobacteraceae TaxID=75682 RepID=UPI001B3C0795|nr:TetR family transcriptional regulator [Herbaspirillum sp. ST 5-3]
MKADEGAKAKRRKSTVNLIQGAIAKLQAEKAKVTISAVAKAANVSSALIHNTYPDLAEKIRAITGKATRTQRDEKHTALMKERETNRSLRAENASLKSDLAKLASVNQLLLAEMAVLKGVASGKVVSILRKSASESPSEG